MKSAGPLVYLVDDDDAVRDSLGLLLRSIGLDFELYGSALDFLEHYDPKRHSCLVADIRMPGLSGLELQQRLNEQRAEVPIIFITGHGDVPMAVNAMKAGAALFVDELNLSELPEWLNTVMDTGELALPDGTRLQDALEALGGDQQVRKVGPLL